MSIFPFYQVGSTSTAPQFHYRLRASEAHSPPAPRKSLLKRILEPSAIRMAFRLRQNFNSRFDTAIRHNRTPQETLSTLKGRTQDKYASGPGRPSWVSLALEEPECDLDKIPLTPYFPTRCRVPAPAIPRKAAEPLRFGRGKRIRDEGTSDKRWTHPLRRQKETDKLPSFSSAMTALKPSTSSGSCAQPNFVASVRASKTPRSSPTVTPSKRRVSKPPESDTSASKRPRLRSPAPHTPQPDTESRQSDANSRGVSPGTQAIVDHAKQALDDAHLTAMKREEDLRNDVKFTEARLADARHRIDQLERERTIIESQLVAARQEHLPLPFLNFRREAQEAIQQLRQQNAMLMQENRGFRDEMSAVCKARDDALKAAATADEALKASVAKASVAMSELRKEREEALKKAAAAEDALKAALESSRTGVETRTEEAPPEAEVVGITQAVWRTQPDARRNPGPATTLANGFPVEEPMSTSSRIPTTGGQQTAPSEHVGDGEVKVPSTFPSTLAVNPFAGFSGGQAAALSGGVSLSTGAQRNGQSSSAFGSTASQVKSFFPLSSSLSSTSGSKTLGAGASSFFATPPTPRPVAGSSAQTSAFGGATSQMKSAFEGSPGNQLFAGWRQSSSSVGVLGGTRKKEEQGESRRKVVVPAAHRLRNSSLVTDNAQRKRERRKLHGNKSYVRDRDA